MTLTTTKYGVPYVEPTDPVHQVDDTMASMAARLDLLLGEVGVTTIAASAANTTTTKRVNYARSYASLGAALVPQPIAVVDEAVATTAQVHLWTSLADATGFTLNVRADSTATRAVKWVARP